MKLKFNSISNKTIGKGLPEKLWGYFFATVVVPIREEMFGDYLRREKAKRDKEYQERKHRRKAYNGFWGYAGDFGFGDFWNQIWKTINAKPRVPNEDFANLGLLPSASNEDIVRVYRDLAKAHHPDKGGDSGMFRKITESKNRCLAYVHSIQQYRG